MTENTIILYYNLIDKQLPIDTKLPIDTQLPILHSHFRTVTSKGERATVFKHETKFETLSCPENL
jgi:hypothetical protein